MEHGTLGKWEPDWFPNCTKWRWGRSQIMSHLFSERTWLGPDGEEQLCGQGSNGSGMSIRMMLCWIGWTEWMRRDRTATGGLPMPLSIVPNLFLHCTHHGCSSHALGWSWAGCGSHQPGVRRLQAGISLVPELGKANLTDARNWVFSAAQSRVWYVNTKPNLLWGLSILDWNQILLLSSVTSLLLASVSPSIKYKRLGYTNAPSKIFRVWQNIK